MKKISEKDAIELLKKYSTNRKSYNKVLAHVKAVQKVAVRIAKRIPGANVEFVKTASLLHDIGRFKCPPGKKTIFHGIEGAKILRKEGLPRHARVCERHLGAGITKAEIKEQKLPLPKKDFVPKSIEEKIIAHADNLIFGTRVGTVKEVEDRFRKEVGEKAAKKARRLYEFLRSKSF